MTAATDNSAGRPARPALILVKPAAATPAPPPPAGPTGPAGAAGSTVSAGSAVSARSAVSLSSRRARSRAASPAHVARAAAVDALAGLAAERLALTRDVAAAKFASGRSVDEPLRELRVLAAVSSALAGTGRCQDIGVRFFRDQIEASKVIQRRLLRRWAAQPSEVPAVPEDLAAQIRPELDRITAQMIQQFLCLSACARSGYEADQAA